MVILQSVQGPY